MHAALRRYFWTLCSFGARNVLHNVVEQHHAQRCSQILDGDIHRSVFGNCGKELKRPTLDTKHFNYKPCQSAVECSSPALWCLLCWPLRLGAVWCKVNAMADVHRKTYLGERERAGEKGLWGFHSGMPHTLASPSFEQFIFIPQHWRERVP